MHCICTYILNAEYLFRKKRLFSSICMHPTPRPLGHCLISNIATFIKQNKESCILNTHFFPFFSFIQY